MFTNIITNVQNGLLAILCVVLISCTTKSYNAKDYEDIGEPTTGDIIFKHDLSDPQGLNPFTTNDNSAKNIYTLIFDALLEQNPETTEFEPSIADSMPIVSDDHLTYTFKLKKNVRFSDGKPLTAKDVLFSFKAVKNPLIIDASALRGYYEDVQDVTMPDDYTVVVKMRKPFFMALIQLGGLQILPKHIMDPKNLTDRYTIPNTDDTNAVNSNQAMKEFAEWFGSAELKRNPELLIGSGPYIYEKWVTGERIILKRNKQYWGTSKWRKGYADAIVSVIINDRTAAISALKTEDIDVFDNVPPALYTEQVDTTKSVYLRKSMYEQSVYTYIGMNLRKPIFSDKRTRKAIAHLVNREYMINSLMRGYAVPIDGPIYRNRPEYDSAMKGYNYDVTKAKQLLAEAGWKDINGDGILDMQVNGNTIPFEFNISFNAGNEIRENIAIILSGELKKVGIKCNVQKLEWSVFLKQNSTHRFDMYIGAWINENIPSDPFQIWHSSQTENEGSNYVGFKNKRADELIVNNRTEFSAQKRTEMMREFQRIVNDEVPYIFLWTPNQLMLSNKRVANINFYPIRPGYLIQNWFIPKKFQQYQMQ
jgi:peptide/nickel transport system substrate-binding protein